MTVVNSAIADFEISAITRYGRERIAAKLAGLPANDNGGGLKFELLADLDAEPTKTWTVYRFLGAGEFSTLYGSPGGGKSIVAADIAMAVAAGLPWFGMATAQAPVVYFAAERRNLMARRLRGLQRCKGLAEDIALCLASGALDIRSDTAASKFIGEIRRLEDSLGRAVGLATIDTLSRTLAGGDENSSTDVGNAVRNIERIREQTGAHIMAVHHSGLGAETQNRMRGSSLINGAVDTAALVTKGNGGVTIRLTKANDGSPDDFQLRAGIASFVTGKDEHGEETTIPYLVEPTGNMVGRPPIVSLVKPPTKIEAAALRSLASAIEANGELTPIGETSCPAGVRSVPRETWRAAFYVAGETESPTPTHDTLKKRFGRASADLIDSARVGSNGPRVWLPE